MQVYVTKTSRGEPERLGQLVLQRDAWDDFGFKTQYHVFYFGEGFEGFLGNVKILQRGQVISSASLLPVGPLAELGPDFCSLGQSFDYYERIAGLPTHARDEILLFLHDALREPEHARTFESEQGWRTSVIRDLDLESYLPMAQVLLERDYSALPSVGLKLSFSVAGWKEPLRLDFAAPVGREDGTRLLFGQPTVKLPERLAILTGRNGSGKSTLLARLARVLHASQADRARLELARLGSIEPPGIGFSRIITIAYSAFDTFQVPGIDEEEKRQIIKDVREGSGRYVFAGLRDIGKELETTLASRAPAPPATSQTALEIDRQGFTFLKPAEQLAAEYARAIEAIHRAERGTMLERMVRILLSDPSFSDIPDQNPSLLLDLEPNAAFMSRWLH